MTQHAARCRTPVDLGDDVPHVLRRQELALLDVDRLARCAAAATSRSVCRDRNAGICRTSATSAAGAGLAGSWMSVRIGRPVRALTVGEHAQAGVEPGAAERGERGAVGLVERRLEDDGTPTRAAMSCKRDADVERVRVALDHARPEDEGERMARCRTTTAPADTGVSRLHLRQSLFGVAAVGLVGRDLVFWRLRAPRRSWQTADAA